MTEHQKQTHQPRKTDRTANTLPGAQKFALWQELVKAQKEMEAEHYTYEQAAANMTQRLGFTVSKANVVDAVRQGIVSWRFPGRGGDFQGRKLAQQVADLAARVSALEDVVVRLCGQAGVSPDGLAARPQDPWVSK